MQAIPFAENGKLVTFGIAPTKPHTGYGYIEAGDAIGAGFMVSSFRENLILSLQLNTLITADITGTVGCFYLEPADI